MRRALISCITKRNYSPQFRDPRNFSRFLNVTDAACSQLKALRQKFPGKVLRVAVEAGGCHGFQYKFSLETGMLNDENDTLFKISNSDSTTPLDSDDLAVICDQTSWSILKEAKLDYSKELIGSAFRIVDNPEAVSGCGCGVSFDLKKK